MSDEFLDYLAKNLVEGNIKITRADYLFYCNECQRYRTKVHDCFPPIAMIQFKATDRWYKEAAANEEGHDISAGVEQCLSCHGEGIVPIPGTYRNCPCCVTSEKEKKCKTCNGKGYK